MVRTFLCVLVLLGSLHVWAAEPAKSKVARGEYLVTKVSMCGDCHSPMNEKGEPVEGQWLRGATLPFQPLGEMPAWAPKAPGIAGLAGWTDEEAIKFLTSGITPSGNPPRPPMPAYRFSKEDAAAVLAYLRSLAPRKDAK